MALHRRVFGTRARKHLGASAQCARRGTGAAHEVLQHGHWERCPTLSLGAQSQLKNRKNVVHCLGESSVRATARSGKIRVYCASPMI
jgi:hypothetical protein